MNPRRLYRCRKDRILAGVAGGMAEYLEVDPTVIRILWILSIFLGGFGILLYILMAFIVPLEPIAGPAAPDTGPATDAAAAWGTGSEPIDATQTGWAAPAPGTTWAAPAHTTWAVPAHEPGADRREGRAGMVIGTVLVLFGVIALAGVLVPGWAASGLLGPAFILALGIALLASAIRRPTTES